MSFKYSLEPVCEILAILSESGQDVFYISPFLHEQTRSQHLKWCVCGLGEGAARI